MTPALLPRTLDGGRPNSDGASIVYSVFNVAYTLLVAGELWFLYRRRSAFCVRIRNLEIIIPAVISLHFYLSVVLVVYPLNGKFPCSFEFWVMSICLPSGYALFQACNAKVLKAYESQRRLQEDFLAVARKKRYSRCPWGMYEAWLDMDAVAKVYAGTCFGLVISFLPAVVVFFGSRRFHASYGFFGPVVDAAQCRKGPEWLPSILLQLFWSCTVGPWILWKIRGVNDVHAWAFQTRLAILAGLPGTLLWVAFTYAKSPTIRAINSYLPPAGWYIPFLILCQQLLIIVPLRDAANTVIKRCGSIASSSDMDSFSTSPTPSVKSSKAVLTKELKPKASMQTLEFSIEHNIDGLIEWTASREFTAENAVFLREVRNFKKKWSSLRTVTTAQRRQMHTEASLIFFTLINPATAETPINIEYKILKKLQQLFDGMEYDPYMPRSRHSGDSSTLTERENVVCPWESTLHRPPSIDSQTSASAVSLAVSIVPSEFSDSVFDDAFESIKYLVFTNTWPRYVEAQQGIDANS